MSVLGIDVGGSSIKAAVVDLDLGEPISVVETLSTPPSASPTEVAKIVAALAGRFAWHGPIGCGIPAAVRANRCLNAANISDDWLGLDARALLEEATGQPVGLINDADAAGLAELRFGAGRGRAGVVILLTLGTGIGSALFVDGRLVPNTELGHLELEGKVAETWISARARREEGLDLEQWSSRLELFLRHLNTRFWPDLVILGGGISERHAEFLPRLSVATEVVPAGMGNRAGIVGAALAAADLRKR